jgi:LCP family protein required for cell wall assembly
MRRKPKKQPLQTGRSLPDVKRYSAYRGRTDPMGAPDAEPPKKRSILKRTVLLLMLVILAGAIFIGIWDARNISTASARLFGDGNIFSLLNSSPLKGVEDHRVNVLLVGYSVDDPGHQGATLTDSIILLSMSTTDKTGYMLSIPRDLYVNIPGFGYAKINEAYQDGGISLLERIITTDFRQPIDYYAIINYTSVRDTVNALGGITVNINSSDPRGLYDPNISPVDGGPLKLPNGSQLIDGQTALNLTRARGDAYDSYGFPQSDFDRTQHQRQVLTAIKQRLNWKLILNPRKNSRILDAVANNVKTDVSANEARPLFGLFNSIPSSSLQSLGLRELNGKNYLSGYTTIYGQSALIPTNGLDDYSAIQEALSAYNH